VGVDVTVIVSVCAHADPHAMMPANAMIPIVLTRHRSRHLCIQLSFYHGVPDVERLSVSVVVDRNGCGPDAGIRASVASSPVKFNTSRTVTAALLHD
jgi:hypothetical protein